MEAKRECKEESSEGREWRMRGDRESNKGEGHSKREKVKVDADGILSGS